MRKAKISAELKIEAVRAYLSGRMSIKEICKRYGVTESPIERWIRNYRSMGESAFIRTHNKSYSKELKLSAVQEYLARKGSLEAIAKKHKILSQSTLKNWILVYSGHKKIKGHNCSGGKLMTKGRKGCCCTRPSTEQMIAVNILNRNFKASKVNENGLQM